MLIAAICSTVRQEASSSISGSNQPEAIENWLAGHGWLAGWLFVVAVIVQSGLYGSVIVTPVLFHFCRFQCCSICTTWHKLALLCLH